MIYWLIGFIGILIYLSGYFYTNSTYLSVQPYALSVFFILCSLIFYLKTKNRTIKPYLFFLGTYISFFVIVTLLNMIWVKPNQFWMLEIFIQTALCGTSIFIGYGIAFILNRIGYK